jgi:hypothetical protein
MRVPARMTEQKSGWGLYPRVEATNPEIYASGVPFAEGSLRKTRVSPQTGRNRTIRR